MFRHNPADDGFLHRSQIIYAVQYHVADGSSLIVWLDRGGNDANGRTRHSDKRRAIVTAKPGDEILYAGQRMTVATVEVWRSLPLPTASAGHGLLERVATVPYDGTPSKRAGANQ
jgi:hypothetical protein